MLSTLTACGREPDMKRLHNHINKLKAQPKQPIEAIPEVLPYQKAAYTARLLRNPFAMEIVQQQNTRARPDLNRHKGPLEAYALEALKMVGTIKQGRKIYAIIAAPDGKVYPVLADDYLGQNHGKIIRISDKKIQVVESYQIGGVWEKRQSKLTLIE